MPFFSIIIPTYNSAAFLQAAIDSISYQTFEDYEIIFVDGVSKDATMQIVEGAKKSCRGKINYISEPDNGIYDAMNKGIDLATGEWLYFMGSDDKLYSTHVLAEIYREITTEPADLIYGNVTGETSLTHYIYNTVSKVLSHGIHHQSIFYKRAVFTACGKYDLFFKVAADYHLTVKAFVQPGIKTRYINLEIASYGESGFSSKTFDYTYFSNHYKLLAQKDALSKLEKPEETLSTSIYCCLFLLKEKYNTGFAIKNLWYYATKASHLKAIDRLKIAFRTMYWSLKQKPVSI